MPPDTSPGLGHPDAAGWALGALDPADAEAFDAHLPDCAGCQQAVAEFEAVTQALKSPAPAVEPSADLGARTLASVQHAIMTAGKTKTVQPTGMMAAPAVDAPTVASVQQAVQEARKPNTSPGPAPARMSRWWHWHWNFPVLLAAACGAAAAAVVMVVVQQIGQAAPVVASFSLVPKASNAAGTVIVHRINNGWMLDASLRRLPPLKGNEYYECWYLTSADAQPSEAITAGSFTSGRSSSGTFPMTSAADPRQYKIMEIAIQRPGDSGRPGTVILRGSSQSA